MVHVRLQVVDWRTRPELHPLENLWFAVDFRIIKRVFLFQRVSEPEFINSQTRQADGSKQIRLLCKMVTLSGEIVANDTNSAPKSSDFFEWNGENQIAEIRRTHKWNLNFWGQKKIDFLLRWVSRVRLLLLISSNNLFRTDSKHWGSYECMKSSTKTCDLWLIIE